MLRWPGEVLIWRKKRAADAIIEAVFQVARRSRSVAPFQFRASGTRGPSQAAAASRFLRTWATRSIPTSRDGWLPKSIRKISAPEGWEWVLRSAGRSVYEFGFARFCFAEPRQGLQAVKVLNATPEIVSRYRFSDEQALLAVLRYNRLVDLFTTTTAYLLQSHLRTTVKGIGQVETDDLYVGVGRCGSHYAIPVQAKGAREKIGVVQIEQDFAVCEQKLPSLIARPLAAQFLADGVIALFEFAMDHEGQVAIAAEKHYRLAAQEELTPEELERYAAGSRARPPV